MNINTAILLLTLSVLVAVPSQIAFADSQEKLDFAAGLEETLGHFWAIELNLDEGNADLAVIHATHPIAELYESMKPALQDADPAFDTRFRTTLLDLKDTASVDVSRAQAQQALEDAKTLVQDARDLVVGDALSDDPNFKLKLMKTLLVTSIAEYGEAVSNGIIEEVAEFQDGSAFVWRSQQILDEIRSDVSSDDAKDIDALYTDLWAAYGDRADPSTVDALASGIVSKVNSIVDAKNQERLDFAAGLEETLGHFWAIELNLDEGNANLAVIHATHPIAELYESMKPALQDADPAFDTRFRTTLLDLKDTASVDVSRAQAQQALEDAKTLVQDARDLVVGDALSDDPNFKLRLMKTLLVTSIAEYGEAVSNGIIKEVAEFQDGSAFVWRSQQILDEIRSDVSSDDAKDIDALYTDLWAAYGDRADPSSVDALASGIVSKIDSITGDDNQARLDFAAGLEETLGHFWAIELNLDEGNADLAVIHATHPIAELYESMKPALQDADPAFDTRFRTTLLDLKDTASVDVSRAQAQQALEDAKTLVQDARDLVVGDALSDDPNFKLRLMKTLLVTSIAEYGEAVSNGIIEEVAEFQDGSAFVWRSQQILDEIRSDVSSGDARDIDALYTDLWAAYGDKADPSSVDALASGIVSKIDSITGEGATGLLEYVETIQSLLADAKSEYRQGNNDLALSYATKAYLDNFEFLEGPLVDAGERDLMEEIEAMLREDLRSMIRTGAPTPQIDAQVDAVLERIGTAEAVLLGSGTEISLGEYWSMLKAELSAAEGAATQAEALAHMQNARDIYVDIFQAAAQENDMQDDEIITGTLADSERLLRLNNIDQVKLNRQIVDKTIYKIAYHEIENAIATNDAGELLRWFDVIEKKFKFSERDYASNKALADIASSGSIIAAQSDTIKSDILAIFKLKTLEEIEEVIQALNDNNTQNAKKFAYEGLYYYRTLHIDVERTLDSDSAAQLLREMEEIIEITESSTGTAEKVEEVEHILAEVELIIREYEGGDTSELGLALSGIKDRLSLVDIEYVDAVADGQIVNQKEYDETVIFLAKAVEIYRANSDAMSALSESDSSDLISALESIDEIVVSLGDPPGVTALVVKGLSSVGALQELSGGAVVIDLLDYVDEIQHLLMEAKSEYRQGNNDLALSHVTKAYLDNYEFLEGPLVDAGERELMLEVEEMMREELRSMIRAGAPVSEVDAQIDSILEKMDTVAVIVPEFGSVAIVVLSVAIVAIVALSMRSRLGLTYRS